MHTKKMVWGSAAIAAGALVLTACGSDGGGKTTAKSVKTSSYGATLENVVNPSDKTGGELRAQASSDFDSLDPARTYYGYSWNFQRLWQRTLMAFDPVPGKAGNEVVPDLAESAGVATDNAKTWTYKIKKGIKFEDGTPVTSKDFKYAVERVFASTVITGGPTYLVELLGGQQTPEYKGPYANKNSDDLKSIETPDDYTIVFHLNSSFSDFNYLMAIPGSTPVPAAVDQNPKTGGTKYAFHPISVGPYKIADYQPNKLLKLVRNPMWDKSTDKLRKALPDTVSVAMGIDPEVMDNNLLNGVKDITIDGFGVQQATVPKILNNPDNKKQADDAPGTAMRYFSLQASVPPLDNIHCRRAIFYAADKVALQYARGGPIAGGAIEHAMVVPGLNSYEKDYNPYPSGPDEKGDLAKAKEELTLCGKPNGFDVNLAGTNSGKSPKVSAALQQGLARVGIKVNVKAVDPANYYSGFIGSATSVKQNKLGIAQAGWSPDFPTEYGYWESIIDGAVLKRDVTSNYARLNDPVINQAIQDSKATTDPKKKQELWLKVSHAVMDNAVLLPFVSDITLGFHPPKLTNVSFSQAFGLYEMMNVGVVS